MSDQTNVYKLKEILERSDEELTGNWSRLASLIKNYEKMEWRDAQKLASQLIKDGKAGKYVADVRKKTSSKKKKQTTKKKANLPKQKKAKVIPINRKRDRFSMNYKRLLKIAPDLIERLEDGEEVYGKSVKTGYMDFNLELTHKDKTGYYLAISQYYKQNGDMVPDPDMQILVNTEFEIVQALSFQNALYYREVYDDVYNRKAVYMDEKKSQNSFLQDWLNNLIKQGHQIKWLQDKDKPEKSEGESEKPDISFVPEQLSKPIGALMEKTTIEEAKLVYAMHEKGKQKLDALALFYIVEKLNESDELTDIPYPKESEIKAYVESLRPKGYDKAMSELKEEIDLTEAFLFGPISFKVNYEKLLKIAPNLLENLPKQGVPISGTSADSDVENQLNITVSKLKNGRYELTLLDLKAYMGTADFGSLMNVLLNTEDKTVRVLSTQIGNSEIIEVYKDGTDLKNVDVEKEKEQNYTLGKWLDTLYQIGITIEDWQEIEQVDQEQEVKTTQKISRLEKVNHNQVLKTNFQKLIRLVPNLFELKTRYLEKFLSKKGDYFHIMASDMKGDFAHVFELTEPNPHEIWTIHVQRTVEKVFVKSYVQIGTGEVEISVESRNEKFGKWLSQKIKQGYKFPVNQTEELLKKYPIVLEWTEGASDENVGFNSLEKLRTRLKSYGFTDTPTETYIKNKLWFRGYPSYVRIDLSEIERDYNPNEQNLLDWLNEYEPDFDWSQFSRPRAKKKDKTPPKKSRKELQKEVENEIPDFEPGEVKLMPAHIKRGIKQKHIDWINKHKQGMTVTPIKRMVNNTKNFGSDVDKKAKKPGFRISRTGKLYYETRSNRSDITGAGL